MKKLLMVFAIGSLLTSCSSAIDKEAADEFCECVNSKEAAETTSALDFLESTEKMTACVKSWQAKYNGKISKGFKDILKESCPDGYDQAEDMGMFEKK